MQQRSKTKREKAGVTDRSSLARLKERTVLLCLGRAAARFIEADREAKEARRVRNAGWLECTRTNQHDIPCFRVGLDLPLTGDAWSLDYPGEELPREKWCRNCRHTAPLHGAARWAYYRRRSARAAMMAAYWRLVVYRDLLPEEEGDGLAV